MPGVYNERLVMVPHTGTYHRVQWWPELRWVRTDQPCPACTEIRGSSPYITLWQWFLGISWDPNNGVCQGSLWLRHHLILTAASYDLIMLHLWDQEPFKCGCKKEECGFQLQNMWPLFSMLAGTCYGPHQAEVAALHAGTGLWGCFWLTSPPGLPNFLPLIHQSKRLLPIMSWVQLFSPFLLCEVSNAS